jgi:hypothetical protein
MSARDFRYLGDLPNNAIFAPFSGCYSGQHAAQIIVVRN